MRGLSCYICTNTYICVRTMLIAAIYLIYRITYVKKISRIQYLVVTKNFQFGVDTLTTTDVDDDVFVCCKSQVMTLRSPLNSLWREIQNYFDHCQVNGLVKNRKEASQTDRDHKQLKVEK